MKKRNDTKKKLKFSKELFEVAKAVEYQINNVNKTKGLSKSKFESMKSQSNEDVKNCRFCKLKSINLTMKRFKEHKSKVFDVCEPLVSNTLRFVVLEGAPNRSD